MEKAIYFDMDGTLVDFYGVEGWLEYLEAEDVRPYAVAAPRMSFSLLARYIHKLQDMGWHIGIVSWLSRTGSTEYNARVTQTKIAYLAKHLPSVIWDSIAIIPYGTPKSSAVPSAGGVLFDDEEKNRKEWQTNNGISLDETKILEVLKYFIHNMK